jgi:hypothetical protein
MPAVSGPRNNNILAISGHRNLNQKSPELGSFWGHKLPGNGYFWRYKLPKTFSFISGAINCQNRPASGAINCQNGRQILYDSRPDTRNMVIISLSLRKIARRTTGSKGYYFLATFLQVSNKSLEILKQVSDKSLTRRKGGGGRTDRNIYYLLLSLTL